MNRCDASQKEQLKLERILSFRLPPSFFRIGLFCFFAAFVALSALRFISDEDEIWRAVARHMLLLGLLMSSLAGERQEDEMTNALRAKSYSLAFIIGVIYSIVQPFIDYGVDHVVESGPTSFEDMKGLSVLLFMLMIQVGFYQLFKRVYR